MNIFSYITLKVIIMTQRSFNYYELMADLFYISQHKIKGFLFYKPGIRFLHDFQCIPKEKISLLKHEYNLIFIKID